MVDEVGTHGVVTATVAALPAEDIAILPSGTAWQVPWELMTSGPFVSCGVLDGTCIRHITVPALVASAVRRHSRPDAALVPHDYPTLPALDPRTTLLDAAAMVVDIGWELAVVLAREPRVITARSVYRSLVATGVAPVEPVRPIAAWSAAGVTRVTDDLAIAPERHDHQGATP